MQKMQNANAEKLSVYVLTHNSEKHLAKVLAPLTAIADDLVVIDSGSTDKTYEICLQFRVRFVFHELKTFKDQRNFAHGACHYDYVLAIDSDEIVSDDFVTEMIKLKKAGFASDAYEITRYWIIQGVPVHSIYPVDSPDFPVRLINREKVHFGHRSGVVHESVEGYQSLERLQGAVYHYTFETDEEIERKLHKYTKMAAEDIRRYKKAGHWYFPATAFYRLAFSPVAAWYKWYIRHKGYKDGAMGRKLGKYAFRYTFLKYKYFIKGHLFKK